MSDEKADVIAEQVRLDLLDQLRDLQNHGRRYIEEYTNAFFGPKTTWRPRPAFHPKLAELIRELVGEAALADRRPCGAAGTPIRQGTGELDLPRKKKAAA